MLVINFPVFLFPISFYSKSACELMCCRHKISHSLISATASPLGGVKHGRADFSSKINSCYFSDLSHHISGRLSKRLTSTPRLTQLSPPPLHSLCFLQVMYSQDKHSRPSVVETNTTSLVLSLPVNQDYVIQIKPFSEGGEGSSSRQITIPKIAGGAMQRNGNAEMCLQPHAGVLGSFFFFF